jgi:hypothetical protein
MGMPLERVPLHVSLTLLESRRSTSLGHRLAYGGSILGQVAMAFGAIAFMNRVVVPSGGEEMAGPSFLAPFIREAPRPVQETISYAALGGDAGTEKLPSAGDVPKPSVEDDVALPEKVEAGDDRKPAETHVEDTQKAFSDIEVDSAASRDPESEGPIYPPTLMAKGIEGSVLATFIVDVTGRPDLETYIPLEATDSLFANAVRDALPRMKFRPAKINDKPVRQLVEQRFLFKVIKPTEKVRK